MADNYLEKRYAELFGSRGAASSSPAPARPSLDTLVKRSAEIAEADPSYVLHPRQLQTIAALAPDPKDCEIACEGSGGTIRFPAPDAFHAGMIAGIMVLKAVELGLRASAGLESESSSDKGSRTMATITIWKNKTQR